MGERAQHMIRGLLEPAPGRRLAPRAALQDPWFDEVSALCVTNYPTPTNTAQMGCLHLPSRGFQLTARFHIDTVLNARLARWLVNRVPRNV